MWAATGPNSVDRRISQMTETGSWWKSFDPSRVLRRGGRTTPSGCTGSRFLSMSYAIGKVMI